MTAERVCTVVLLTLVVAFGVLNALGIQPGEDNNRWLLYLFLLAWPLLSLATLVAGAFSVRNRRNSAILAISVASLSGFVAWGHLYAGLW